MGKKKSGGKEWEERERGGKRDKGKGGKERIGYQEN